MSVTAVIDPIRTTGTPSEADPGTATRPRIEAVPRSDAATRPRMVYGVVAVAGLFLVIAAQLLVSIGLSQGAYTINGLQIEQRDLQRSNAEKQDAVDTLSSPQNLAGAAQSLGMVANTAPVYLRLSDGAVLGDATTAADSARAAGAAALPNALLGAGAATATQGSAPADLSASQQVAADGAVALQGQLPAPDTH